MGIPKHIEVPQVQIVDEIVDVPVEKQVQVPHVQKVQKTVKVPTIHTVEKVIDVPVVKQVEEPHIITVEKHVEVPMEHTVEKVVEVPQIEHVQGETKHIHAAVQGGRQAHPAQVMHVEEEGPPHPPDAPVQVYAAPPSTVVAQPVTTGSV